MAFFITEHMELTSEFGGYHVNAKGSKIVNHLGARGRNLAMDFIAAI